MKCHFEKNRYLFHGKAFTLPEVIAATLLLGLICGSILVVINRCMATAADEVLRMQAFEVARDNMEKILAMDSVPEKADFGESEKYPNIKWETTVETFYEPVTSRAWFQALCVSRYMDSNGQDKTVEFTHWLGGLTADEMAGLLKKKEVDCNTYFIKDIKDAAKYVDVDEDTIKEWVANGIPMMEGSSYTKGMLDLYMRANGKPDKEQVTQQQDKDKKILDDCQKKQEGSQDEIDNTDYSNVPFCKRPVSSIKTKEEFERWTRECLPNLLPK